MYNELLQYYTEFEDTETLDRSQALWLEDEETRWEQLKNFIDEFVISQEYEDYLEQKRNIIKKDAETQYDCKDYVQIPRKSIKKVPMYPLTREAKKMAAFIRIFECYLADKRNDEIVQRQREGINVIRSKIEEVRKQTACSVEQIKTKIDQEMDNETEEFYAIFNFDLKQIKPKYKIKIKETVISCSKIPRYRNYNRRENLPQIAKIILERLRKSRKSSNNKVNSTAEQNKTKTSNKEKKLDENQIEKIYNKKRSRLSADEILLPTDQVNNRQQNGTPGQSIADLVEQFTALDDLMENAHIKKSPPKFNYPNDNFFVCDPKRIVFNSYEKGKTYRKIVSVRNCSFHSRKFRFMQLATQKESDKLLFEIQPVTVNKVNCGSTATICIKFTPDRNEEIFARLMFLSYDEKTQECQKFSVRIICTLQQPDVKINTSVIHFGKVPIWKTNKASKTLRISNDGAKPCDVFIRKLIDPLHLSEETSIDFPTSSDIRELNNFDDMCAVVQSITREMIENVFSNFEFEMKYFQLGPFENKIIKINMKNIDFPGNYIEKHIVEVDGSHEDRYNEFYEIIIDADVTGHFINVLPEILDFGSCFINSVYQLNMEIKNNSTSTHAVAVKVPCSIKEYIKPDNVYLYLSPGGSRSIRVRFFARKGIMESVYFDKDLLLLEVPLEVHIMTKNYSNIFPVLVTIFAVVTCTNLLNIRPLDNNAVIASSKYLELDLGQCSIYETVVTVLAIENNTSMKQIYGFTDLPSCLTFEPNYGFRELDPGCQDQVRLLLHPDSKDFFKNLTKTNDISSVEYTINIKSIYSIKPKDIFLTTKKLLSPIHAVLVEMFKPINKQLQEDISNCVESVRKEYFKSTNSIDIDLNKLLIVTEERKSSEYISEKEDTEKENGGTTVNDKDKDSNTEFISEQENAEKENHTVLKSDNITQIKIKFTILKPLIDFSYQFIQLPDAACGSYSFTSIEIKALNIKLHEGTNHLNNRKALNFEAWFKITGDNHEIRVEPSCGILKSGQSRKIYFIATPVTPEHIIKETARSIKYSEIYELKKREYERAKRKKNDKRGKKEKSRKNKSNLAEKAVKKVTKKGTVDGRKNNTARRENADPSQIEPEIKVSDSEIVLNYEDYYPAEMSYWRTLNPYTITSNFTCAVTYTSDYMVRPKELISLQACCRVVRPDFISKLNFQRIDFGSVVAGMSEVKEIIIQNIKYEIITIRTSLLNPTGPFSIDYGKNLTILPESYLKLPIKFSPTNQQQFEEYVEITSTNTILPLVLQGFGVAASVSFSPAFVICRLNKATVTSVDEHVLKILNNTNAKVNLHFEKVFEIEGIIKPVPVKSTEKIDKISGEKEITNKTAKTGKSGKTKVDKKSKLDKTTGKNKKHFTDELTPDELYSIPNFVPTRGASHFDLINVENGEITLEAKATRSVRFGFGMKDTLKEIKQRNKDKSKKRGEKEKGESYKKSFDKNLEREVKTVYIAKYNILTAENLLKELILICSFK
ncbi:uncharacterized protein [Diabrotica undecimpunctata]|uniref:uncharacterized protein isoform X2 n=1 Tax=Diabrotica undecimpunctata TaxID=50387 RepID=UPI003B63F10E